MAENDTDSPQTVPMSEIEDGMGFSFSQGTGVYIVLFKYWYNNGNCVCVYVPAGSESPGMATGDMMVYPS